jgi:hypothetical protein
MKRLFAQAKKVTRASAQFSTDECLVNAFDLAL